MGNQLKALSDVGQSVWLDNIRRSMFASGELHKLIDSGLRGMTSNPTIFEKAIGAGSDYDEQLQTLADKDLDPTDVFEALAIDDIRHACDEFRPLYDSTNGGDGFVSLEVSPLLAKDAQGTVEAAKRLWKAVDRPNVMIKIPSTPECLPAVTETIAAGINVNITLIFSIEGYEATANAYIAGLEQRAAAGEPIDKVASVASVFVSRIDTAVDKMLNEKIGKGEKSLESLLGKAGIAGLKVTYARFKKLFESERFAALAAKGAKVQRPLWASTGTKNPAYSDLLYVENLVGKHTVNTMPPATLDALVDHGVVKADTIEDDLPGAIAELDALAKAGISIFDVTSKLQVDGVASFSESFNAMLGAIKDKVAKIKSGHQAVAVNLGKAEADPAASLKKLAQDDFLVKLWKLDPTPWSADPNQAEIVKKALGWLEFPKTVLENLDDLTSFAADCAKTFAHVVVLGMGGSSLTPGVLRATFGKVAGYPQLHVLDSSDPVQIKALEDSLDLSRTVFIVSSKSGITIEPEAFLRYFFERSQKTVGARVVGGHFLAITDAGTELAATAKEARFGRLFINDPTIGGRYSALSYSGMIPAAMAGYDVKAILNSGIAELAANSRSVAPEKADGVRLGATLGELVKHGRDKLTLVTHPAVSAFGMWAEQLIAESTGKNGTGIIPIEGETLGSPGDYGDDRIFVYVGEGLPHVAAAEGELDPNEIAERLSALEEAGHPVIRLRMNASTDIGAQFALWEIATATAGAVLGINPFDQPDVQESKDNTVRLLARYAKTGSFVEPAATLETGNVRITALSGSSNASFGTSLESAVAALAAQVRPGDYVAFTAYFDMSPAHRRALRDVRLRVRSALKVATTAGFGPRFLHSTGQLHKGGPATGIFFQLTADSPFDLPVPGTVTFKTLARAEALGDFESLDKRSRRGARLHFTVPAERGLAALAAAFEDALAAAPVH